MRIRRSCTEGAGCVVGVMIAKRDIRWNPARVCEALGVGDNSFESRYMLISGQVSREDMSTGAGRSGKSRVLDECYIQKFIGRCSDVTFVECVSVEVARRNSSPKGSVVRQACRCLAVYIGGTLANVH